MISECWDGLLNDIYGKHVKKEHVFEAIDNAKSGLIEQGSVGAGTGMKSFGFKAGIGSASRVFEINDKKYTVGVLLNNNIGNEIENHNYLRINGKNIGEIVKQDGKTTIDRTEQTHQSSTIIVIATDLPLSGNQLNRLSKKAVLAMGRLGCISYTDSGDFILSFSTANKIPKRWSGKEWQMSVMEETSLNVLFEATVEAVEEAFINSLFTAETMIGFKGNTMEALPVEKILKLK